MGSVVLIISRENIGYLFRFMGERLRQSKVSVRTQILVMRFLVGKVYLCKQLWNRLYTDAGPEEIIFS